MKAYRGENVQIHAFLSSALDGGEWSASHSGCFTPKERAPGSHLYRRLVGPQSPSGRGGGVKSS
jgi:hypothetical protein